MALPPTPSPATDRALFLVYLAAKGLHPTTLNAWQQDHYIRTFYTWMTVLALMPDHLVQTRMPTEPQP